MQKNWEKNYNNEGDFMDYVKEMIEKLLFDQYSRLSLMKDERKRIKGGAIKRRKKGNQYYYTEVVNGKEFGITKDAERVKLLQRKQRITKEMQVIKKRIDILEKAIEKIRNHKTYTYANYSLSDYKWMTSNFESNPIFPEALQYKTLMGTMVRSKSELNIANALERLGVPYRYEAKIDLVESTYYPDFTILKMDKSILIWEHNGLMDDLEYAEKAMLRTQRYEESGYRQHRDLIITYEDDIRTPQQIENIIKRYVFF